VPVISSRTPVERAWAERVRANRDQVDRVREVPDGRDFYAPVTSLFRADPRRTDEPVLDLLRALVEPGDTWLDIGAGAGRYALPIALLAREVIALDPSSGMLSALRDQMTEFSISNIRPIEGRWPPDGALNAKLGPLPAADVGLIAHVGYDVEAIGPFVDGMESAARRLCVAVLMERQPASVADPFWPRVHGESRVPLPALPDFLDLLRERGREPAVTVVEREPRTFESRTELAGFLRRQLWIADGGEKERRYRAALDELVVERDGGVGIRGQEAMPIGVAVWHPRTGAAEAAGNRGQGAAVSGP
jgi:SAM-dependent methyltransferase